MGSLVVFRMGIRANRNVSTLCDDTLVERYEHTMSRLEEITRAGYQVNFQWSVSLYPYMCKYFKFPVCHSYTCGRRV